MQVTRSKWLVPGFALRTRRRDAGGFLTGGHSGLGLYSFGVMATAGALILFGGRSETIRGLRGDGRDERFSRMDLTATAVSGLAVTMAVIVAFLVEVARGHDGMQYAWLGAVAGLAYLGAIVLLRLRG